MVQDTGEDRISEHTAVCAKAKTKAALAFCCTRSSVTESPDRPHTCFNPLWLSSDTGFCFSVPLFAGFYHALGVLLCSSAHF